MTVLDFKKMERWTTIQGFESNKFELKVWNIFEIKLRNLIQRLKSRIKEIQRKEFEL
jgi:hypothetical protein